MKLQYNLVQTRQSEKEEDLPLFPLGHWVLKSGKSRGGVRWEIARGEIEEWVAAARKLEERGNLSPAD